jgi:hypothetical protein
MGQLLDGSGNHLQGLTIILGLSFQFILAS